MNIKETGSFYTPKDIAVWMSKRSLSSFHSSDSLENSLRVLEPSCGDGVFLNSLPSSYSQKKLAISAVECDDFAIEKAKSTKSDVTFFHEDFLFWKSKTQFDLIIGNPPYIVKSLLTADQSEKCKEIHMISGLKGREVANIWTAFVVKCTEYLSKDGVLSFVLPTELLQVNYSKEIRHYLLKQFARIEVISFKSLAFDTIEQDTVILNAYKNPKDEVGLFFSEVESVADLKDEKLSFEKHHGDYEEKWSSYILTEDEIKFVKGLVEKCSKVSDLCSSVAGIVTAANDYFIVSQEDVERYDLSKYVKSIIQKGIYVNGSAELLNKDYEYLKSANKPCYIIDLNNVPETSFTDGLKNYLKLGEEKNIPKRYKCKLRKRWFDIPSIWKSEGFFFKRGHHYPKLLVNKANVHVTDSAYRIRMKEGSKIEDFTMSFYNSLTLLCSELGGRYYGGGVLEITPNEFKRLPIPEYKAKKGEYKSFIHTFKQKTSIESFLLDNDNKVLSSIVGITDEDVSRVNQLYKKVKNRRLRSGINENYT